MRRSKMRQLFSPPDSAEGDEKNGGAAGQQADGKPERVDEGGHGKNWQFLEVNRASFLRTTIADCNASAKITSSQAKRPLFLSHSS
jgi:hypothetical protein